MCRHSPFVDDVQLAEAKADGAAAAMLPLAVNGKEGTKALMDACDELGLEAIVRVCDAEQLAAALELEAKMVALGSCTLSEAEAMLSALPAGKAGPVSIADFPYLEVRGAWKVRVLSASTNDLAPMCCHIPLMTSLPCVAIPLMTRCATSASTRSSLVSRASRCASATACRRARSRRRSSRREASSTASACRRGASRARRSSSARSRCNS